MGLIIHRPSVNLELPKQEDPVLKTLRGWNTSKTRPRGWLLMLSGETQSGKSTMGGHIAEQVDPSFTESLRKHPVYTGDQRSAVYCRLSSTVLPLLVAVRDHLLPKPAAWIIDEPDDVDSKLWYLKTARAIKVLVGECMNDLIDVILMTRVKDETLGDLRNLAHFWINIEGPGYGTFYRNGNYMSMKSPARKMHRRPWVKNPIRDAPKASALFHELYPPIKEANKQSMLGRVIEDALKADKLQRIA